MTLPLRLTSTHYYRVSGRYLFAGDLFIARRVLYFFPVVDLADQRSQAGAELPDSLRLVVWLGTYVSQFFDLCDSVPQPELWKPGMSDELFRANADAFISWLKQQRGSQNYSQLPLPTRVEAHEITSPRLTRSGKLSFLAQSDNHDFKIGWRRGKRLRDALWEADLVKN